MIKMSEVLEIMQEREDVGFWQGWLIHKTPDKVCYCAIGALIKYHYPDLPEDDYAMTTKLLSPIYPELYDRYNDYGTMNRVWDEIARVNDRNTTTDFRPVIKMLKERGL